MQFLSKKKKLNFLDKISQRCIIREYYYANKLTNDHFCYGFFNFTILKKKKRKEKEMSHWDQRDEDLEG